MHILGAPDMAVKLGAPINLTCVISQSPDQLQFIFWYRDDRMINYDINAQRGKIVVSKLAQKADSISSNLQIFSSQLSDSGNYTCMPSGARPMSIQVHVLEGKFNLFAAPRILFISKFFHLILHVCLFGQLLLCASFKVNLYQLKAN